METKVSQLVIELKTFCNQAIKDLKADNESAIYDLFKTCPACEYAHRRMMEDYGYSLCQHCPIDTVGKPGFTFWDPIDETFYHQEFPYCYLNDFYNADSKVRKLQVLEQFKNAKVRIR